MKKDVRLRLGLRMSLKINDLKARLLIVQLMAAGYKL